MPTKKRTSEYPAEFRTQAVQLALTSDKSRRVVADELGIGLSTLCKWVKQHHRTPNAAELISPISGLTTQQALEQENRRLKRELEIVRQEREILKAATRFFAKENQ
jgi:transposase